MCHIFSGLDPDSYAYQTRSVRLAGHATSIRLETAFWRILDEIARLQGVSLGKFLTKLHEEVLAFTGQTQNFTSLLRCACLAYLSESRSEAAGARRLEEEAADAGRPARRSAA